MENEKEDHFACDSEYKSSIVGLEGGMYYTLPKFFS